MGEITKHTEDMFFACPCQFLCLQRPEYPTLSAPLARETIVERGTGQRRVYVSPFWQEAMGVATVLCSILRSLNANLLVRADLFSFPSHLWNSSRTGNKTAAASSIRLNFSFRVTVGAQMRIDSF